MALWSLNGAERYLIRIIWRGIIAHAIERDELFWRELTIEMNHVCKPQNFLRQLTQDSKDDQLKVWHFPLPHGQAAEILKLHEAMYCRMKMAAPQRNTEC